MAAVSMGWGIRNALQDHRSDDLQWDPARLLLSGVNPYRNFIEDHDRPRVTSAAENNALPNYPVTGYVFLAPLGALEWNTAKKVWALTNLLSAAGVVWAIMILSGPAGSKARGWALAAGLLMLCSAPARDQIAAGQHTFFSTACLLWAWILGRHSRWRWLSSLLIAASWLKFSVTVPLTLAFLIHGRWREPAIALAVHVMLLAQVCWWIGEGPVELARTFFESTRLALFHSDIRSDVWDSLAVARALWPGSGVAPGLLSLGCLAAVTWVAYRWRRSHDALLTFALLALPACLVGFHLRYDFIVFALLLAWALGRPVQWSIRVAALAVAGMNWIGARMLEKYHYEAFDAIHGVWSAKGAIGMGTLSAGTWLILAWLMARLSQSIEFARPLLAHHLPPRTTVGRFPGVRGSAIQGATTSLTKDRTRSSR